MIFGNKSLQQFDVLIIGSGAGGSIAASVLCEHGKKVLVLEAGANHFDGIDDPARQPVPSFSHDELKFQHRNLLWPDPLLADLKTPRFQPTDFQLGTLIGSQWPTANFADWPVTYDMLERFYVFAEKRMRVQGEAGADPFEGPRSAPSPMKPGVQMFGGLKVAEGARKLGLHPFAYPGAVNSRPYEGRPPCNDCGFCTSYACPTNARGTPPVTSLRKALLTNNCHLHSQTRVVKLVTNGAKNTITGVEAIGRDGEKLSFTADTYVLVATAIEDARLLLLPREHWQLERPGRPQRHVPHPHRGDRRVRRAAAWPPRPDHHAGLLGFSRRAGRCEQAARRDRGDQRSVGPDWRGRLLPADLFAPRRLQPGALQEADGAEPRA
jgi:choline dehydrogenase-like flavoprotein